jgi:hypothetical protein
MSTPTNNGATDIKGAAGRIASMFQQPELERPTGEGENPSQEETPQEVTPEVAAENAETPTETPQGDTEEASRRFKAKLGDRDVEFELLTDDVDIDLIPKGLMMEADYRKKTMELGDNRKSLEAKQTELDGKFQEAAELIQFEVDNLESQEMLDLKEYDPDAYWKKFDQIKKKADKLTSWRQEQQGKLAKQQDELLGLQSEKVPQLIPDWLDSGKKDSDLAALQPYLAELGFNDQELQLIGVKDGRPTDARLLAMARKAMMFDNIKTQDIEAKRVTKRPKSVEPTGGAKPNVEAEALKANRAKLKKSGNLRDAQAAFSEMFKFK